MSGLRPERPWEPLPGFFPFRRAFLGWWIAGAVSLVAFSRVGFFNPILGVFIEPLETEFGWSRATIAGSISLGTVIAAVIAPFLGPLVDRWGARWILGGAVLTCGLLLLLLAAMDAVWQFYLLFGLGRAATISVMDIAIVVVVSNWFIRNRGRAMGLTLVGTRAGMALMPLIVLLFLSVADWRAAFAALGLLVLLLSAFPAFWLVRRRPEDVGLLPDGDSGIRSPLESGGRSVDHDPRWTARQAMQTRAFWLLLLGTGLLMLVSGTVNLTIASHLQDNGLSRGTAISVVTLWAAIGIIGGLVGGEAGQRIPVRFALPAVICVTAGGVAWLMLVDSVWMAYLFAVWHGLAFGAQLPLNQISFPNYFGRWSAGAIRGATAPVQFGLNAVGPVLAGFVFDARGSYDLIYAVFVALLLFGALSILLAVPPASPAPTARPQA